MLTEKKDRTAPQETKGPELVELNEISMAELLRESSMLGIKVKLEGRTIEQLAQEVVSDEYSSDEYNPSVYGIITFQKLEGTAMVRGKSMEISGPDFDHSGTTYIDGQFMTLDDLKTNNAPRRFVTHMEKSESNRVIRTRTGRFQNFNPRDQIISLPKPNKP